MNYPPAFDRPWRMKSKRVILQEFGMRFLCKWREFITLVGRAVRVTRRAQQPAMPMIRRMSS